MTTAVLDRRTVLSDAALDVLARTGARGLTHRAVDERAGLPQGSTSNYFRTRDALLLAALDRLLARESALFGDLTDVAAAGMTAGRDTVIGVGAAAVGTLLGPGRDLTLARQAIFAEACRRPELQAPLTRVSAVWWDRLAVLLAAAGSADPARHARWLLAALDGLVTDQLCRPEPAFDARAAVRALVAGILP